jgi:putative heme-binding domain-containing protein
MESVLRGVQQSRHQLPGTLQRVLILSLADGLGRAGKSLRETMPASAREQLAPWFKEAAAAAADQARPRDERVEFIRLLAHGPAEIGLSSLPPLLTPLEPESVQFSAVRALANLPDERVGVAIVERWSGFSPGLRREGAEALFARADRIDALLDAVEAGQIPPGHLDPARRQGLLTHSSPAVRQRAEKMFAPRAERQAVLDRYVEALKLSGDAARGRAVYEKHCATCHKAAGLGHSVGPDLNTVRGRTAEELMIAILDPNREVQPNDIYYVVETTDGRTLSGILAHESASSVMLRRAQGEEDTVLRSNIEELRSTSLSIMPEELEGGFSPQDLGDLIRFNQMH